MRTLVICVLATTLVGCSSQQSTQTSQPSCFGLNPFACLTAVQVPIEAESHGSNSATAEPVSLVAWRGDRPPRSHADHAVRRTPKPIKVAAKAAAAVPIPLPSPQTNQPTTGNAVASEAAPASEAPRASEAATRRRSAFNDRRSADPNDTGAGGGRLCRRGTNVGPHAGCVAGRARGRPRGGSRRQVGLRPRRQDNRDRRQIFGTSIRRVRTAMAAAGAPEVQLSKGQTTAINRLVAKEVPAAVVGLVSASAADSFPELARFRIFQFPLSSRSSPAKP